MAKIKKTLTEHAENDKDTMMKIDIMVDVNSDGLFTTTLKPEDAEMIESYGVKLEENRAHRSGFFKNETMAGLCHEICSIMKECLNYTVISNTPVLRYFINTYCHYCLHNETGDIAPNGKYNFVGGDGTYRWKEGTANESNFETKSFGLKVYVRPYMKRIVEYGNGKQKVFYDYREQWEKGSYMEWLNELSGMRSIYYGDLKEIEGTEENARFFVNIIKQICRINEQIGEIVKNDKLEDFIQQTLKLEIIK